MASPITQAIKQICDEKGISYESVMATIEAALAAAFRKDFGNKMQNIKVNFDPETSDIRVFDVKEVVEDMEFEPEEEELEGAEAEVKEAKPETGKKEQKKEKSSEAKESKKDEPAAPKQSEDEPAAPKQSEGEEEEGPRFNPKTQIMISDAKDIKKDAEIGDEIKVELEVPGAFGRMAAQTAKQVITQKLREAERETIFEEYKDRVDEVINAVVQRREGKIVLIDLGRATGIMRPEDQVPGEYYRPGERIKVYVVKVEMTTKGPEIILSRSHPEMVRRLFELEIPEIAAATVEIKGIAREAGSRSKVAVYTEEENVDPIGSCIGQRGTRIQTIIAELGGEKIDIIEWSDDPEVYIKNSLSPAKVNKVELKEEDKTALATVASDQLSLAIGKGGQNVRLAAKLTGWKINVAEEGGDVVADSEQGELAVTEGELASPKQSDGEPATPKQSDGEPATPKQSDGEPASPKQSDGEPATPKQSDGEETEEGADKEEKEAPEKEEKKEEAEDTEKEVKEKKKKASKKDKEEKKEAPEKEKKPKKTKKTKKEEE